MTPGCRKKPFRRLFRLPRGGGGVTAGASFKGEASGVCVGGGAGGLLSIGMQPFPHDFIMVSTFPETGGGDMSSTVRKYGPLP